MLAIGLQNNIPTLLIYLIVVQVPMIITYLFAKDLGVSNLWLYFVCLIIGLRVAFFKDGNFKRSVETKLFKQLQMKNGKSPSKSEIVKALNLSVGLRDVIFFANLIIVLVLTAIFNQF